MRLGQVTRVDFAMTDVAEKNLRNSRRSRVLKRGVIAFNQRHSTLECTVRDMSEGGCRIASDAHRLIPDTFELLIELDGLWYPCEVAWRRPPQVGARFTGEPQPSKVRREQHVEPSQQPPLLRRLRRV